MVCINMIPDNKIHGANVGPTWVLVAPSGPHVGHTNLAIWKDTIFKFNLYLQNTSQDVP